jgi:hypothetical protein
VGSLSTPAAHLSLTPLAECEYAVDCGVVEDRKAPLMQVLDHNFLIHSMKEH